MNARTLLARGARAGSLLVPLLLASACSNGGGGGGKPAAGFLQIEARVDKTAPGSSDSHDVLVAASDDDVCVVWEDDRGGVDELYCNLSTDGGLSWRASDIRIPTPGLAVGDVDLSNRSLAWDASRVYVAFEQNTSATNVDDMYVNASTDGGLTWMPQSVRIDTDAAFAAESDDPAIACDGEKVYVVWQDDRDGSLDIRFNRSLDGGQTWLPSDVRLDTDVAGAANSVDAVISVDSPRVYVVWQDDRNGGTDVYLNASTDDGQTWLPSDVRLGTALPGQYDPESPILVADDLEVLIAWLDDRGDGYRVWFSRSTDGGASWSPEVRLDTTTQPVHCEDLRLWVADQRAYVVWKSKRNGNDDIFLNVSPDRGVTWLADELRLDTDAPGVGDSDDPDIAAGGDDVVVCWEDDRNGNDDIYLNYSRDGGLTWLASDLRVEQDAAGTHDADRPRIAGSASGLWIVWEDYRNGNTDIYTNGGVLPQSQP